MECFHSAVWNEKQKGFIQEHWSFLSTLAHVNQAPVSDYLWAT